MTATSIGRTGVPLLALVVACGAALVFGTTHVSREPPVETGATTAAPAVSPPASDARDEGSAALATSQADANALSATLDASPRSPVIDASAPVFDIARIERTGDAVIAGRAAPGAIVELLRNGEPHDRVVADQSGQFVLIPPRLPPGDYELTLRSTQPDGKQATSKQSVVVALVEVESSTGTVRPRTEAAIPPSDGDSSPAVRVPKIATTVVSRGDSLWRISRFTYGAGTRYTAVYKANRDQIRNPNRIYPGQVFVLPDKMR